MGCVLRKWGVRCLDGRYEPTVTNSRPPFTAGTHIIQLPVGAQGQEVVEFSLHRLACLASTGREGEAEGLWLASSVPGLSPVS